jgi:MFS family permease
VTETDTSTPSAPTHTSGIRLPFVRAFAIGRIFAVLGSQSLTVAVQWQLYERTGSAWALAWIGICELVPVLALFVPVGHLVDRVPRRHVAMFAHGLFALIALGFLATTAPGVPVGWTYALLVGVGVVRAFSGPSVGTILPQLLDPVQFAHTNGWMTAAWQFASVGGPVVGGALIAATGDARLAFVAAAVGQVVFLACLLRVPLRPARAAAEGGRRMSGFFAGFAFVARTPVFLAAITLDLFAVLLGGAVALLPIFAKDVLHVGPAGLGWLRAAPGLGALVMALSMTRMAPWRRPGLAMLAAVSGFGVATIGFGLSTTLWLSLACLFLTGVFDSVSVVIRMTLEQMVTPDALRGRVAAVKFVFIGLSNELGAFESGSTAALFGAIPSVVGGGIGTLVVAAIVAWRLPALARIGPLATLRPASDDEPAAAVGP